MSMKKQLISITCLFWFILAFTSVFSQSGSSHFLKNDEYELVIYFADGSVETAISEIYEDEKTDDIFFFSDCKRIYPSDTKGLYVRNSNGETFKGIAKGNNWFFENSKGGKLSTFRTRPDAYNKANFKTIYFRSSKDTSTYLTYSKKLALELVSDNPEALSLMKKHFNTKTSQTVLYIAGGTIIVATGFYLPFAAIAGLGFIPGSGATLGGFFLNTPIKNHFYESLDVYNSK